MRFVEAQDEPAWLIVPLVASLLMIAPFTVDAYLPSFGAIATEFGVDQAAMQHTLSLYLWFFGGMMLVHGPLSDAWGRRRMVLVALLVYAVASVGAALARDLTELIWARIGQGVAAGAGVVIGRALVRDLFSGARAQKVMSNVTLVFAMAPAIAPVIGGWLAAAFGWRSVFWFLAVFAAILLMGVLRFMPETVTPDRRQSMAPHFILQSYARALCHAPFVALTLVFALLFAGMFLYIAAAPVVLLAHLHQSPTDFWKFFVPVVLGLMLGSRISNALATRLAPRHSVWVGLMVSALGAFLNLAINLSGVLNTAPGEQAVIWIVAPILLYAMGMSTAMPSLNLMGLDYLPTQRGLGSAVQGFMQMMLAGVVSGFCVAVLAQHLLWLALGMVAMWLLAALLYGWWSRHAPQLDWASERAAHP
ncbi:multidrug effflux MFS transporter [Halothiobacillus sp. DCM-1]|uniref:multidrug effflux MFS transporter n=1 Tax=Halothiobacillus sp. DCM-1 TaxID=3112558 RepID=UPI00325542E0